MPENILPSITFLATCHLIAFFTFCLTLIIVIYRILFKKNVLNRKEKIIAIGISSILFPKTIQTAFVDPIAQLVTNLQKLFYVFQQYNLAENNDELRTKLITEPPLLDVSVANVFQNFPLAHLFAYLACCVIIYLLAILLKSKVSLAGFTTTSFNYTFLLNLMICGLLLFSLFLVLSVFICIPYSNEMRKPSVFTKARIDSVMNSMINLKDTFTLSDLPKSPFINFSIKDSLFSDTSLLNVFNKADKSVQQETINFIPTFQSENDRFAAFRNRSINAISNFAKDYRQNEEQVKQNLSINFDSKSQSLITDKSTLFLNTRAAFEYYIETSKSNFSNYKQYVALSDQDNALEWKRTFQAIQQRIRSSQEILRQKKDSSINQTDIIYSSGFSTPLFSNYPNINQDAAYNIIPNSNDKDGSDWGFLGSMSKYLIKTQSTELVLLIGMFGFGLLGASILSFEKLTSAREFLTMPIIKNFGNVLARGFGAALVVYMAIKAGLTIFTAGTSTDANGYMLLLTCFAAAVFSDKIWDKLKDWVGK